MSNRLERRHDIFQLPELGWIHDNKYRKYFVSAAVDLHPDLDVNNLVSMDESFSYN
jgi:hypothetical protein